MLDQSLRQIVDTQSDIVAVVEKVFPELQELRINLDGARLRTDAPRPIPIVSETTPALGVENFALTAKGFRVEEIPLDLWMQADNVQLHQARDRDGKLVLVFHAADSGSINVSAGKMDLERLILIIAKREAEKHGVAVVGLKNSHHIGRVGHWAEQCARAGLVSTHWVNVHGHKSLVAPFGGAEPRFTTNPYCTAVPRKGKEPIVLDFATSQVAAGKVRVANNKKVQMEEGLLIDSAGKPTTDPGVLYNPPYGAILPFGLHKGGGLAVICDLLAGALTGGRTHSPRTIKTGTDIINNMLSVIIDPTSMGGTEFFEDEVETFITWVKSARPQPGVAEVLSPGEPERARRIDREKNGVPIDTTTWQQLLDIARKVRLNDTDIPSMAGA
jgi:uncharacterized oxidoreductase